MKKISIYRANNTFNLDDFSIKDKEYLYQEQTLDDNDNLIKEITYSSDNQVESLFEYAYNSDNKLIKELLIEEGEVTGNKEIEYNQNGKIDSETSFYSDDSYEKTMIEYSDDGKISKRTTIDDENEITNNVVYEYQDDLLVQITEYDEYNKKSSYFKYAYNSDNLIEEEISHQYDETWKKQFLYDENKRIIQTKKYNISGQLKERISYTYDEKSRVIETLEENVNGTFNNKTKYNDDNLIVEESVSDKNDILLQQIERVYDENKRIIILKVNNQSRNDIAAVYYQLRYVYTD